MNRLLRPPIPLSVKLEVATRQYKASNPHFPKSTETIADSILQTNLPLQRKLDWMLRLLYHEDKPKVHLDHDPALENRTKIFKNGRHVEYDPPANDPNYLLYRTAHEHHIKTNVRGDGAQYPDRVLAKRERHRKKRATKKKSKWPARKMAAMRVTAYCGLCNWHTQGSTRTEVKRDMRKHQRRVHPLGKPLFEIRQ